jgi:alkylation response protein AidB-like acyl-CoA dehydrogenase
MRGTNRRSKACLKKLMAMIRATSKTVIAVINRQLGHTRFSFATKSAAATGLEVVDPIIGLTSEQGEFYKLAREFADKELKPFAQKWDEESIFPVDVYKKCADLGFAGIFVKDDVGGTGLTRVDTTVIIEALATGCVGTTAMLTIHNMCAGMIDKFGNEAQRAQFLPGMCKLDLKASYCLTEPGLLSLVNPEGFCCSNMVVCLGSGSDASSLTTRADLDTSSNEYVVNGGKAFISGAGMSDIYLVMCRTGAAGPSGISCLVIPKDARGLSLGGLEKKMGWNCQPTRQITFEDVRIPASNLLGKEGGGFRMAMAGLDGGRLSIGACSLGAAQACLERALAYVKVTLPSPCRLPGHSVLTAGDCVATVLRRGPRSASSSESPSRTSRRRSSSWRKWRARSPQLASHSDMLPG